MKLLYSILFVFALVNLGCDPSNNVISSSSKRNNLNTQLDSISYALGVFVSTDFKKNYYKPNKKSIEDGFKDCILEKPKYSREEMYKCLGKYLTIISPDDTMDKVDDVIEPITKSWIDSVSYTEGYLISNTFKNDILENLSPLFFNLGLNHGIKNKAWITKKECETLMEERNNHIKELKKN